MSFSENRRTIAFVQATSLPFWYGDGERASSPAAP